MLLNCYADCYLVDNRGLKGIVLACNGPYMVILPYGCTNVALQDRAFVMHQTTMHLVQVAGMAALVCSIPFL